MLGSRRVPIAWRSRFRALRRLYIRYNEENTPEARGLRLLRAWLSPAQFEQFDAKGYFDVIGSATGSKYRIQSGTSMNVYEPFMLKASKFLTFNTARLARGRAQNWLSPTSQALPQRRDAWGGHQHVAGDQRDRPHLCLNPPTPAV
jgi:hypothetical protein